MAETLSKVEPGQSRPDRGRWQGTQRKRRVPGAGGGRLGSTAGPGPAASIPDGSEPRARDEAGAERFPTGKEEVALSAFPGDVIVCVWKILRDSPPSHNNGGLSKVTG